MELIERSFLKPNGSLESEPYFQEIRPTPTKSRIYKVNLSVVLEKFQEAFGIEDDPPHALYEDKIWSLGHFVFEKRPYELIFVRCLEEHSTGIWLDNLLETRKDPTPLTLTSTMNSMIRQKYSKRCPAFTLSELLGMQKKGLVCRKSCLKTELSNPTLKGQGDFYVSPDGHTVVKNDKTYYFYGFFQPQILKELWQAHEQGVARLQVQALLEKVGAKSKKLNQIFKNHETWHEIIVSKGGYCWFRF